MYFVYDLHNKYSMKSFLDL